MGGLHSGNAVTLEEGTKVTESVPVIPQSVHRGAHSGYKEVESRWWQESVKNFNVCPPPVSLGHPSSVSQFRLSGVYDNMIRISLPVT